MQTRLSVLPARLHPKPLPLLLLNSLVAALSLPCPCLVAALSLPWPQPAPLAVVTNNPLICAAEGKIKAAVERASLAGVVAALAAVPGRGPSVARVAAQAAEFICKCVRGCGCCWGVHVDGLVCGGGGGDRGRREEEMELSNDVRRTLEWFQCLNVSFGVLFVQVLPARSRARTGRHTQCSFD